MTSPSYIILSGASGTGKTTLAETIVSENFEYKLIRSVGRKYIKDMDAQRATTEKYFKVSVDILKASLAKFVDKTGKYRNLVFERSPIDSWVYLQYAIEWLHRDLTDAEQGAVDTLFSIMVDAYKLYSKYSKTIVCMPNDLDATDTCVRGNNYASEQVEYNIRLMYWWEQINEVCAPQISLYQYFIGDEQWRDFIQKTPL